MHVWQLGISDSIRLSHAGRNTQVLLSFFEKRVRQQWGLAFGKQEERLFWEQWYVAFAWCWELWVPILRL